MPWKRRFYDAAHDAELAVIAVATVVLALLAIRIDAFEKLSEFVARHDDWQLDEVVILLLFVGAAALVLLFRRARDLRGEITRREVSEELARSLARHDPLTGLANRRVLAEELEAALARVRDDAMECAVFLIDLDRFKPVNDAHGHAIGDAALIEAARRITAEVGPSGTVARMGGDEFACVIAHAPGGDLPARLAGRIGRALAEPFRLDGRRLNLGGTIGIARAPYDGATASELLHAADLAMYEGKRLGRGAHRFFHAEMDAQLRERAQLENDLREAIGDEMIVPHFQPVMELDEGRIIGFEALARWEHPARGMVPPDTFIPLAEDLGIVDELSYSILRNACEAAREWPADLWLSVNISPLQLKDPWLATRLLSILTETGLAPSRLIVEVTENAMIDDLVKARDIFSSLQNAGVKIALDDFGRGFSSLYHLRKLHFDHLKIDRSFVHSMDTAESAKIVSAVTGLGKSLGMPVTAEGVETWEEARALRELGCERAQGFLFGRALDAVDTLELVRSQSAIISHLARSR